MRRVEKTTLRPLHVVHLGPETPVLHLQLHDASTQQVGLLLHQLQVDSDLRLAGVGGVSNLGVEGAYCEENPLPSPPVHSHTLKQLLTFMIVSMNQHQLNHPTTHS